jgi:hypothetical protein
MTLIRKKFETVTVWEIFCNTHKVSFRFEAGAAGARHVPAPTTRSSPFFCLYNLEKIQVMLSGTEY